MTHTPTRMASLPAEDCLDMPTRTAEESGT